MDDADLEERQFSIVMEAEWSKPTQLEVIGDEKNREQGRVTRVEYNCLVCIAWAGAARKGEKYRKSDSDIHMR